MYSRHLALLIIAGVMTSAAQTIPGGDRRESRENRNETTTTTTTTTATTPALDTSFQIRYTCNLNVGDSIVDITNTGANGASLNGPGFGGPAGNICVNVYAFSPDEQLISCCSCLVTPNGLVSLSVVQDLISNPLTGIRPDCVVVKLLATPTLDATGAPTFAGTNCTGSAGLAGTVLPPATSGLAAWGTTLHASPTGFQLSETQFTPATLGPGELTSIATRCGNIIGNGSGFGICKSCRAGALGASKQ